MFALKIIVGVVLGAAAGALMGRSRVCSAGGCGARNPRIASVLGGALLGAAVAYYLTAR